MVSLSGATISGGQWQTVSGGIVETASGSHNVISSATIVSGSVIEVTDGGELTLSGAIANAGTFAVSAAVSAVTLDLGGATLSGGRLATSGASALIETVSGTVDMIRGGTIVSGSHLAVVSASTLTSSGGSVGAGATVSATSGSTLIVSGTLADSGTLALSGVTSVAAHATLATLSGGSALVTGTVLNSGTLIASGIGEPGRDRQRRGGQRRRRRGRQRHRRRALRRQRQRRFLSNGSGGLEIADTANNASAFTGTVSGFGGTGHANHKQFIDLVSVISAGLITSSYVSANAANTSGTLFVSSGGVEVAAITMVGHYSAGNFHITAGSGGTVEIVDPAVAQWRQRGARPTEAFPRDGIDLPNIAFGAQTTLAYAANAAGTGGTLTVSDGRHAASDRAPRQLHGRKLRHHGRRPRRHAGHGSVTERTAAAAGTAAAGVTTAIEIKAAPMGAAASAGSSAPFPQRVFAARHANCFIVASNDFCAISASGSFRKLADRISTPHGPR